MARIRGAAAPNLTARIRRRDGALVCRWGAAPGLRAAGVRAFDLYHPGTPFCVEDFVARGLPLDAVPLTRHGAPLLGRSDGRPMDMAAASAAAKILTALARTALAAPVAHGGPADSRVPARRVSVGDLLDAFMASAALADKSPATRASYASWRPALDDVFFDLPVCVLEPSLLSDWFDNTRRARGHHMAHGAWRLLRRALNWGAGHDWPGPAKSLDKVRFALPPPKVRVGDAEEMQLILAALDDPQGLRALHPDAIGAATALPPPRPAVGDAFVLALWTGQRRKDILALTSAAITGGRLRWITSKTGKAINIPLTGPLPKRLDAAMARHRAAGKTCQTIISPDYHDGPYQMCTFSHHFAAARNLAARVRPSLTGHGKDPFGRAWLTFTFADCRDTAITRLARAGCNPMEIAAWSNHEPGHVLSILRHYGDFGPEMADNAGRKLDRYTDAEGLYV